MNFVFISPNYPESYWMFCRGLKKYGATVLAIVDQPYDSLSKELKEYCDEIYVVDTYNDYDAMLRAVAFYTFKYGKIDWIESNNEAWLHLDAQLRDDFNIKTGFDLKTIEEYQSKAGMKKYYEKAGIPTARYRVIQSLDDAIDFVNEVGFPVVMKPDHGVGAGFTYQIESMRELKKFYTITEQYTMIIEEYIDGDVFTLDGLVDHEGKILYMSSFEYVGSVMDSVVYQLSIGCYTQFDLPQKEKDIAQRVADAFQLKNRFFHGEYFRLRQDKDGLGKKGDVIGLELNFRPPGGLCPDLMNYAGSLDVYDLWAEVILKHQASYSKLHRFSAAFAGRRNSMHYTYNAKEIKEMFNEEWIATNYLPPAYAQAMGDEVIIAKFSDVKTRTKFFEKAFEVENKAKGSSSSD